MAWKEGHEVGSASLMRMTRSSIDHEYAICMQKNTEVDLTAEFSLELIISYQTIKTFTNT